MPLDHRCRLDQYNRVDDLRPNPVEPHPQQPIERRKLRPAGSLSPQHGQLMTHGDQLNFQRDAAAKTEGEERNNGGENSTRRTTSLSISMPKVRAISWAIRGQPIRGLRRLNATIASMSSCDGPFGPGRR